MHVHVYIVYNVDNIDNDGANKHVLSVDWQKNLNQEYKNR